MMITSSRRRHVSDNLRVGRLVGWLWFACILTSALSTQRFYSGPRYGKRKETGTLATFQTGSRFGRADPKLSKDSSKLFAIVPRVDRLFYVSRYGKRSSSPPSPLPANDLEHEQQRYDEALKLLGRMKKAALEEGRNRLDYEVEEDGKLDEALNEDEGAAAAIVDSYLCGGRCKI